VEPAGAGYEAVRRALAYELEVGRFSGAERSLPTANAQTTGGIGVSGDAGPSSPREARAGAPVTADARRVDSTRADRPGQDAGGCAEVRGAVAAIRAAP